MGTLEEMGVEVIKENTHDKIMRKGISKDCRVIKGKRLKLKRWFSKSLGS